MVKIASLVVSRDGYRDDAFPGALFADYGAYRTFAPECRSYAAAVAAYAAAIKPATVSMAVRAARARGYGFIDGAVVRESAAENLRESLLSIGDFDEAGVQWHVANPGKRMPAGYF